MSIRTDIINILRSRYCRLINFRVGSIRVYGAGYATVATTIEHRHIQIVQSLLIPSTKAAYNKRLNVLLVGRAPSRNLIVHEATHALNDWHKRNLSNVEDEVSAYVAQMMFLFMENHRYRKALQQPSTVQRTRQIQLQCQRDVRHCNNAAIGAASEIAIDILAGNSIDSSKLRMLREALGRDPNTYPDPTSRRRVYNGILRRTIPAEYLQRYQGVVITN